MAPITQDVTPTASAFCPKVTQGTNQVIIPGGMGVKKVVVVVRKVSLASSTIKTFFGFLYRVPKSWVFSVVTVFDALKWAYNPNHSPNLDASPNH